MKRKVLITSGVIVLVLTVAGVFGWQRVTANAASSNVRAQTATVTRGSLTATVNAAGNVFAPNTAALSFSSSGRVAQVNVQVGDRVKKGQLLMQLDSTDQQLALKTAQTNFANAQASYDATKWKTELAIRLAESNVTSAQATLDAARAKNAMNSNQITIARAALDKATTALQKAQNDYNAVAWRPDIGMTAQSVALQQASLDYESAQANYQIATAGINDTALRQAEVSFDLAQIALAQAQKNLDTSMRSAQATLDGATLAVDQAQRNLDKLNLNAPFDGIVSAVNYGVNDSTGMPPAVSLVDVTNLQVKVMVSEVDLVKLRRDETAMISVDALPGAMYHGTLSSISPVGMVTSGVVDYPVVVTVQNPDEKIKPGMTANLAVTVERHDNVLLVPLRAIRSQASGKVVMVESQGQTIPVAVEIGLSNETQVEVKSGLREGDVVVMNQAQANTSSGNVQHLLMGATMGH